jgi:uncharacterized phage protein (TIGR01671 family)
MTRPIKFRAFDKETQNMKTSKHFKVGFNGDIWAHDIDEYDEDRFILMQFTGLTDAKGKEIWEGDVVNCAVTDSDGNIIGWQKDTVKLEGAHIKPFSWLNPSFCEVIGNIYENQNLLQ